MYRALVVVLLVVFSFTAIGFEREQDNTIEIRNTSIRGLRLSIYQNNYGEWEHIDNVFVPSGRELYFDIGNDYYFNFGYIMGRDSIVTPFYGEIMEFY